MRGDSLRDFYAKTLALTGSGTLAVVGALVDSWPGSPALAPVPTPTSAGTALALLAANPVPDPAFDETPIRTPVINRATRTATALGSSYSSEPAQPVETLAVLSANGIDDAEMILTSQFEPHLSVVPAVYGSGAEVRLGDPADPTTTVVPDVAAMPSASVENAANNGTRERIITGAFKTAGSSIVKGGAKTGASVKAGFRMLSSAFRKALPG